MQPAAASSPGASDAPECLGQFVGHSVPVLPPHVTAVLGLQLYPRLKFVNGLYVDRSTEQSAVMHVGVPVEFPVPYTLEQLPLLLREDVAQHTLVAS